MIWFWFSVRKLNYTNLLCILVAVWNWVYFYHALWRIVFDILSLFYALFHIFVCKLQFIFIHCSACFSLVLFFKLFSNSLDIRSYLDDFDSFSWFQFQLFSNLDLLSACIRFSILTCACFLHKRHLGIFISHIHLSFDSRFWISTVFPRILVPQPCAVVSFFHQLSAIPLLPSIFSSTFNSFFLFTASVFSTHPSPSQGLISFCFHPCFVFHLHSDSSVIAFAVVSICQFNTQ